MMPYALGTTALLQLVIVTCVGRTTAINDEILIESFSNPIHKWHALNDPVMGGESTSSVIIDNDGVAIFDGKVVDVPFLQAPGFIQMEARDGLFPDVSTCDGIKLTIMSSTHYDGYRVGFGNVHVPGGHHAFGYKANFDSPSVGVFGDVVIPFHEFSAKWDDATGDQIVTCDEDPQYCPDVATLKDMRTFALWGEGVAGDVHLEVKSITAVNCGTTGHKNNESKEIKLLPPTEIGEDEIMIESFIDPVLTWTEMNDPVMGGKSTGTFKLEDDVGHFHGEVVDVPFLGAPGFIKADGKGLFPDVSSCMALKLTVKAFAEYSGFRISFGLKKPPHSFRYSHGFKSDFHVPVDESFLDIVIPFRDFSDKWSEYTGDQIVTCQENPKFCPDRDTLRNMKEISVWGEGVAGDIDLEIKSISAVGCSAFVERELDQGDPMQIPHPLVVSAVIVVSLLGITKMIKRRSIGYEQIRQNSCDNNCGDV